MASKMGSLGRVEANLGRDPILNDSLTKGLYEGDLIAEAIGLPSMRRNAGVKGADVRQATIGKEKRWGKGGGN